MPSTISYPVRKRYTLQWLINADSAELNMIPNKMDAAFMTGSRKPKPSDLILHYNYGAAAVKQWGHGLEFFKNRANPPRPSTPVPAPMGASKTVHDRTSAIGKRGKLPRTRGVCAGKTTAGKSEEQELWDEDDVMLFCWANTPAAKERHRKKVQETNQRIDAWRENVPQGLA